MSLKLKVRSRTISLILLFPTIGILLYLIIRLALTNILPDIFLIIIFSVEVFLIIVFCLINLIRNTPKWLIILNTLLEITVIIVISFVIFYTEKTISAIDTISSTPIETTKQVDDITNTPFIVYISGIDQDGNIATTTGRSDVNIVAVINPVSEEILFIDIPRDYYIPVHGIGQKDKLTHTGLYGVQSTVATVEDYLGIDINYYIRVNFDTVKEMIDIIGGLDLYSDTWFRSGNYNWCYFYEGNNHVDGTCALAFARERYAYGTGDMHRASNQGQVITKIIEKISNPIFLASKYLDILDAASRNLQTDISSENIAKLIHLQLDEGIKWKISQYTMLETESHQYGYLYPDQLLWMGEPVPESVELAKSMIHNILQH